jgi:hypothetical protein
MGGWEDPSVVSNSEVGAGHAMVSSYASTGVAAKVSCMFSGIRGFGNGNPAFYGRSIVPQDAAHNCLRDHAGRGPVQFHSRHAGKPAASRQSFPIKKQERASRETPLFSRPADLLRAIDFKGAIKTWSARRLFPWNFLPSTNARCFSKRSRLGRWKPASSGLPAEFHWLCRRRSPAPASSVWF